MTWAELIDAYATSQTLRSCTPATLANERYSLGRFLRSLERQQGEVPDPQNLAPAHLAAYQNALAQENYSPHTIHGWVTVLRSFLRWAARRGHLLLDPTVDWDLPHPPAALFRVLTVAEVKRVLERPDPTTPLGLRDRAVMECLYGLALRRAECANLNLTDLDFSAETVRLARVKGGRARLLPLPPQLAQVLERYLEAGRPQLLRSPEPALFLSRWTGQRLGGSGVESLVTDYGRRTGLTGVCPHRLRHACASHLLEAGADVRVVQQLLGHASVTTTQIYTHLFPVAVVRTHRRTHPRARR